MTDILTNLNFNHLACFVAVVEEGGIVPAAKRLHVSHPTVSEQVKKLEHHLNLRLFELRGRKLQLTENGKMVYSFASQIFGTGSSLLSAVEGRRAGTNIVLRVGIDSVLAKLTVRKILSPLLDEASIGLRLRCTEDHRDRLIAQLSARQIDMLLSDAPAQAPDHISQIVASSHLSFFASPKLKSSFSGIFPHCLNDAPMILPMPGTRLRRELERWFGENGLRPMVVAEIDDSALVKAFGQDGRGVFAMSDSVRDEVCHQYEVVEIGRTNDIESRVFALTHSAGRENLAVNHLFASQLK
jgi:LysR family transcriptional activator of nhaA